MSQTDLYDFNRPAHRRPERGEPPAQLSQTIAFLKWQEEQWREWDDEELRFDLDDDEELALPAGRPRDRSGPTT